MGNGKYYVTTPIYYTNDNLHIGHTYTTVAADAIARYHRMLGDDTFFLTGTDEHGQKVERRAAERGKTPKEFVDGIVANIKELWRRLDVQYDHFIRTTDKQHEEVVQEIFQQLYDQGDIYKAEYEGWYCVGCEAFYTETQVKEFPGGRCPDHDTPLERLREESYFFRLSKYADRLLEHIETHPDFIQPASRRNEMVSFIKQGLEDLCVSRTTHRWGIPVPFDPKHVIYVWIDALSNYITAIGYRRDQALFERYWPAELHLVGKEIVRFHTIIWPILLMALGLPLPEKVYGHGWLVLESGKMSKSKGNVIDPLVLIDKYSVDAVRYYLLREIPFGADGYYTEDALILRTNVDLANDLGNLLSRTTAMIDQAFGGKVPAPGESLPIDAEIAETARTAIAEMEAAMDRLEIPAALAALWKLVGRCNKYIDETSPWSLARDQQTRGRAGTVLYNLAESLRIIAVALCPFLPTAPERIWQQLGLDTDVRKSTWDDARRWGGLAPGTALRRGKPLFPRIETKPAKEGAHDEGNAKAQAPAAPAEQVSIDEFRRLDLRVAKVVSAEKVAGADKLLRLIVDTGGEQRQIVAGIAKHYAPEEVVGQEIIIVANLAPAKIRGLESRGMLLAASNDEELAFVTPARPIAPGSKVK